MKKTLWCLVALSWLCRAGALPSFEPFADATASGGTSYTNGGPLYHQTNALGEWWARWNGGNTTQAITCTNTGLAYGGFPAAFPAASTTNAAYIPGNDDHSGGLSGQQAALIFSKIIKADPNNLAVNSIYASFLIQVPTLGTLSTNATYFAGFATNDASSDNLGIGLPNSAMKIFIRGNSPTAGSSTTWSIGVANNSGQGSAAYDAGGHIGSTVLFVVVDYEFGINGGADFARIWVNPAAASFGASAAPTPSGSTAGITAASSRITQAADFFLQDRTSTTMWGKIRLADLRVGTTWSYVTGGPEVVTPPANLTLPVFNTANLSIAAVSGSTNNALTYQWRKNGINLTDGGSVSGSTNATLSLASVTETSSGTYSVVVSNVLGAVTNSALLTVLDPYISLQPPAVLNIPTGSIASISTFATGTPPVTGHWFKNGALLANGSTVFGSVVSGAATTNLTITASVPGDSAIYTFIATNGLANTVTSSNCVLTVNDPVIVSPPQSLTINYLGTASFFVSAAGTPPFGYQWQLNGTNLSDGPSLSGTGATISGSHTTNLVVTGTAFHDGGNYSVVVTNGVGHTTPSSAAVLTVLDPYIIVPPVSQTVAAGTTANLSVTANGSGHVTYQWQKNGTSLSNGGGITGATSPNLQIASLTTNNSGIYSVIVSGAGVSASAQAVLTVVPSVAVSPGSLLVTNFQGWGCSLAWWANVIGGFPNREYYADLAFKTLKLNIVRYNIGGGENPNIGNTEDFYARMPGFAPSPGVWDWTADANQRWILQAAVARGVNHVEAFVNSPPWWMTASGSVTGASGGANNLLPSFETTFTSYVATVISNLTTLDGIHFDYVTPMNEPQGGWSLGNYQEGNHVSTDQQARLVNSLRTQLNAQGLATGIDASEDSSEALALTSLNAYDGFGYSPPPLTNVDLVSLHTYGNTDPTDVHALAASLQKPMWMTEYGNTDPSGMSVGRRIHDDMIQLRPNAWICWQFVKNDSHTSWGLLYNPLVATTDALYTTNSIIHETFYVMGQFSEFISPGSLIISVGDNNTLAAYNATNQTLVLVTVNDSSSPIIQAFDLTAFNGLPAQATASRTSITENMAALPNLSVTSSHLINTFPGDSVTTMVLSNVTAASLTITPLGGGQQQLAWGIGTLQSSTNLLGQYQTVTNATSPWPVSSTNTQQFFRLKLN